MERFFVRRICYRTGELTRKERNVMKRVCMVWMILLFSMAGISTNCLAQKGKKNREKHDIIQLHGTIKLVKDKDGKVTDIALVTKDCTVYKLTMNEATKSLEEKDGQAVELSGYIQEMDGSNWFTIEAAGKKAKGDGLNAENKPKKKKNKQQ
jgi:hypothetical protein